MFCSRQAYYILRCKDRNMAGLHIQTGLHLAVAALLLVSLAAAGRVTHKRTECKAKVKKCENVNFVPRAEWQAMSPKKKIIGPKPVNYSIVHHTATTNCTNWTDCSARVTAIQTHHIVTNGWDDIGYNFLIGGDKRVYEGRGWGVVGTHAGSYFYNCNSIGIAVIGNYTDVLPSPGVLNVLRNLLDCSVKLGYLTEAYILKGHKDVRDKDLGPTDCPGDELYAEIRTWPHYCTDQPESP